MRYQAIKLVARVTALTGLAVVATLLTFLGVRWATGVPYDWVNVVECLLIPTVVGPPILFWLCSQSERLAQERARLATTKEEVDRAHRELMAAHKRLRHAASRDRMTGLLNREAFLAELEEACGRDGGVLLIADADHFKQINDLLGHLQGDRALVAIATAIRTAVRASDVVGRIGGEEFGIILRGVALHAASDLAEGIRRQVAMVPWSPAPGDGDGLSISIGGASLDGSQVQPMDALGRADRCLYQAKALGRNRVVLDLPLSDVA